MFVNARNDDLLQFAIDPFQHMCRIKGLIVSGLYCLIVFLYYYTNNILYFIQR